MEAADRRRRHGHMRQHHHQSNHRKAQSPLLRRANLLTRMAALCGADGKLGPDAFVAIMHRQVAVCTNSCLAQMPRPPSPSPSVHICPQHAPKVPTHLATTIIYICSYLSVILRLWVAPYYAYWSVGKVHISCSLCEFRASSPNL